MTLTHDGTNKQASDFGNASLDWTISGLSTATAHATDTNYPNDIKTATTGTVTINKGLTDGSIIIPINNAEKNKFFSFHAEFWQYFC